MYKAIINNKEIQIEFNKNNPLQGMMDGVAFEFTCNEIGQNLYLVLYQNKSFTIEIVSPADENHTYKLKVNNTPCEVKVGTPIDQLLNNLGLNLAKKSVSEIKAPMPGMVLQIPITVGDTVKKGDILVILEAMKMENSLKSPVDGTIKTIHCTIGKAVDKNQLLISFS